MKFINYPIIQFSIAYMAGLLVAHFSLLSFDLPLYSLFVFPVVLAILWFLYRNKLSNSLLFGILTFLFFILLGYTNYNLRIPKNQPNHFIHFTKNSSKKKIQLQILEPLKSSAYYYKYKVEVTSLDSIDVIGNALLLLKKDTLVTELDTDTSLLVYGEIENLKPALNPDQFDYATYLKNQKIYGEIKITKNYILKNKKSNPTLKGYAHNFRKKLMERLHQTPIKKEERSIIQALLLGEKRDIDPKLYKAYAAAGAVHILAVSGLHVGVFYFLFGSLFSFLKRFRFGNSLHAILVILLLWGFAFVTGLSPSVTRAVTMFSFFGLATMLNKRTNSLNTLALSFLLLLLISPKWLFQVGFQLSYLAVFFIVWLMPLFSKIYAPKTLVGKRITDIIFVSIAAQLGVLPLSLYYFHQFPGLFLVSNILILPGLALLLGAGLVLLALLVFDSLPDMVAVFYGNIISILNDTILFIASKEAFLFKNITISITTVLLLYTLIISGVLFFNKQKVTYLKMSLITILLILLTISTERFKNYSPQLVIFHKTSQTLMATSEGSNAVVLSAEKEELNLYPLQNYLLSHKISNIETKGIPSYFTFDNQPIIIIDSNGVYSSKVKNAKVILTQSPKIHIERLVDSLQPKEIIADGSNYTSYITRWKATCEYKKIPFHYTGEKGAYILKAATD